MSNSFKKYLIKIVYVFSFILYLVAFVIALTGLYLDKDIYIYSFLLYFFAIILTFIEYYLDDNKKAFIIGIIVFLNIVILCILLN